MLLLSSLITLNKNVGNLTCGELLAAAGGDDGRVGNGSDGGLIKGDAHLGEGCGKTNFKNEVGKAVNTFVGILNEPDFLRPATEFRFSALVDVAVDDGMQYGKPLAVIAVGVGS